jgi:translation initiation factor 3 subunit H
MEKNGVLEITNSFPFPEVSAAQTDGQNETVANLAAGAPRAKQNIAYGNEMIKFLREVNVDANNVGWYTSTSMGNFVNLNTIENQFYYQSQPNERTVALIYDVSRSSQGTLNLRAYRLSPSFVTAYKEGKFTTERYVQPISCQGRKLTIPASRRVVSDTTTSWLSSQLPFATPTSSPRSYTSYLPMRPRKSSSSHPT